MAFKFLETSLNFALVDLYEEHAYSASAYHKNCAFYEASKKLGIPT